MTRIDNLASVVYHTTYPRKELGDPQIILPFLARGSQNLTVTNIQSLLKLFFFGMILKLEN